jgi:hypothetical protein
VEKRRCTAASSEGPFDMKQPPMPRLCAVYVNYTVHSVRVRVQWLWLAALAVVACGLLCIVASRYHFMYNESLELTHRSTTHRRKDLTP